MSAENLSTKQDRTMYIELKKEQRKAIKLFLSNPDGNISKRAAVILAYADGFPTIEVSKKTGMSTGRCRYWKRRFQSDGLTIFPADDETVEVKSLDVASVSMEDQSLAPPVGTEAEATPAAETSTENLQEETTTESGDESATTESTKGKTSKKAVKKSKKKKKESKKKKGKKKKSKSEKSDKKKGKKKKGKKKGKKK